MSELDIPADSRLLTGAGDNEDAAILTLPPGKALVQTLDFFTPVVNDPFRFGQIAAANALSDVYAMGGTPYAAMNIVCFPAKSAPSSILRDILRGGLSKVLESGAALAGGHSVEDDEIKFGLSVSGLVEPGSFATNKGLLPGDTLILTKPLGTGVLATALKAGEGDPEVLESLIWRWAARLNKAGAVIIPALGLKAATDITGFGLGGHLLEMSKASGWAVRLNSQAVPMIAEAMHFAASGFVPVGSHANRKFFSCRVDCSQSVDPVRRDLVFDAQTSGGLLLAVPKESVQQAVDMLLSFGDLACAVGEVLEEPTSEGLLYIL